MERVRVATCSELRAQLARFGSGMLFRGQTELVEQEGMPFIKTSFDRHGCIPPVMIKWSKYARSILRSILQSQEITLEFTHAILQHYGWRSWYVDCSVNPAVAAWFASHEYSEKEAGGIFEDYAERPVHLDYRLAHYDFFEGDSHLYVLNPFLVAKEVGLTDLSVISLKGAKTRAEVQAAWLLGPLQNCPIPEKAFVAYISGPRSVFRSFANESGFVVTDDLFPTGYQDPILGVLLSLPWQKIGQLGSNKSGIPIFRRSLSLPEYQPLSFKIASPTMAFNVGHNIGTPPDGEGIVIPVGSEVLYGSSEKVTSAKFPRVLDLVKENGLVVFETDELLRHPHMTDSCTYQKGIVVLEQPGDLIVVSELVVEHPGLDLANVGGARGWFYRIAMDGTWIRERHVDECDCTDEHTHFRHLESLRIVELILEQ